MAVTDPGASSITVAGTISTPQQVDGAKLMSML